MSNVLPSVRYMAQLDGIRAFAVFGVIIDHWASAFPSRIREFTIPLDLSRFGVHMFFVLSGFLITSILLSTKSTGTPIRSALGHFYVRRILRIFPVYYATLLVACFFSDKIRDAAAWHALYLTNIYTSSFGVWLPAGHFWSLAVEEQFYLVWPLVILAVPLRSIRAFAVLVLVLAPASRFLLYVLHGGPHLSIYTSLMTNLDLLCFGGLLAYCKQTSPGVMDPHKERWLSVVGTIALLLYFSLLLNVRSSMFFNVFGTTLVAVGCGALVLAASRGVPGVSGWIIGNPAVVWLGTISYGLYIFHPFIPEIYLAIGRIFGVDVWKFSYYIRIPAWFGLLLLISSCSYYFFEKPIRGLKRYYG